MCHDGHREEGRVWVLVFLLLCAIERGVSATASPPETSNPAALASPGEAPGEVWAGSWLAGQLTWKLSTEGGLSLGLEPQLRGVIRSLPWELTAESRWQLQGSNPLGSVGPLGLKQGKLTLYLRRSRVVLAARERLPAGPLLAEAVADRITLHREETGGRTLDVDVISTPGASPIARVKWEWQPDREGGPGWLRRLDLEAAASSGGAREGEAGVAASVEGSWPQGMKGQGGLAWTKGGVSTGLSLEYRAPGWAFSVAGSGRSRGFTPLNAASSEDLPLWSLTSSIELLRSSYRLGLGGSSKLYPDGSVSQFRIGGEVQRQRSTWLQWMVTADSVARSTVPGSSRYRLMLAWSPSRWPGVSLRLDTDDPLPGFEEGTERSRLFTLRASGGVAGWPFSLEGTVSWREREAGQNVLGQVTTSIFLTSPGEVAGGRLSLKSSLTWAPVTERNAPGSVSISPGAAGLGLALDRLSLEGKWERSSPRGEFSLVAACGVYFGQSAGRQPEWRLEGRWTPRLQWGQPPVAPPGQAVAAAPADLSNLVFLAGRVFVDNNGNGRFDQGEEGVSGAVVTIDDRTKVKTDAQGRYELQVVGAGRHVVALEIGSIPLELGLGPGVAGRRTVELQAGREGNVVDFALVRLCSLSGLLFLDGNGNGRPDPGEPGLGGVFLQLVGTPFSTFTAGDGSFALYDVYPGQWQLRVEPGTLPETADQSQPVEVKVNLAPGEIQEGLLIAVPPRVEEIEWTF